MLTHLRRDDAIRSLPLMLPWCLFVFLLVLGRFSGATSALEHGCWGIWCALAGYLGVRTQQRRASVLDLALPLSARWLWLAHSLALGLGGATIVVLGSGFLSLVGVIGDVPGAAVQLFDGALRLVAGAAIAVVLLESRRPALVQSTRSPHDILYLVAVLAGTAPAVLLLDGAWVIGLLGLALGWGLHTWRSLPPAFVLEPVAKREPAIESPPPRLAVMPPLSIDPIVPVVAAGEHRRSLPFVRLFGSTGDISRGVIHIWPGVAGLVICGVALSAGTRVDRSAAEIRPLLGLAVLGILMLLVQSSLQHLAMLDPLPVSRRALFAAMTLPPIAALASGFGLGALFRGSFDSFYALFGLLVAGLWLGLVALFLDTLNGLTANQGTLEWIFWVCIVVFYGSAELFELVVQEGWSGVKGPADFGAVLSGRLDALPPGGAAALVLTGVLLLAGAYALAEARFRCFEVPPRRGEW